MKKNHRKKKEIIRVRRFSWVEYIIVLFGLGILGALPGFLHGVELSLALEYLPGYIIYWAVVSGLFCALTAREKSRTFDKPMQKLSKAAGQVAQGDFSVYVESDHAAMDQQDYVDIMFQDFNKMVEALGSLETMKNDFIANVSHEFKTPLAVIESYTAALGKEDLSPELRKEYIDTIRGSTRKLAALVTNILKLNKLDNQVIQLNNETFELTNQIAECVFTFEKQLEAKGIELDVEMDDRVMMHGDPSMLVIVWQNILSNAIKFSPQKGIITLRQISDSQHVTITIKDAGCGMDEDTLQHIFDKFYQGKTTKAKEGNGLGMALTKKVVDLMAGEISVVSAPGEGTSITVRLPLNL